MEFQQNHRTDDQPDNNNNSGTTADNIAAVKECGICLDEIKNPACTDVCPHVFCFSCLKLWCKRTSTCPLCRKVIGFIRYTNDKTGNVLCHSPSTEEDHCDLATTYIDEMRDVIVDLQIVLQQVSRVRQRLNNPRTNRSDNRLGNPHRNVHP